MNLTTSHLTASQYLRSKRNLGRKLAFFLATAAVAVVVAALRK